MSNSSVNLLFWGITVLALSLLLASGGCAQSSSLSLGFPDSETASVTTNSRDKSAAPAAGSFEQIPETPISLKGATTTLAAGNVTRTPAIPESLKPVTIAEGTVIYVEGTVLFLRAGVIHIAGKHAHVYVPENLDDQFAADGLRVNFDCIITKTVTSANQLIIPIRIIKMWEAPPGC